MKENIMTELHDDMNPTKPRNYVTAYVTEAEAKALDSINVIHPVVYLDCLHEHPENFKKLLPELEDIMEEIKLDPVTVTVRRRAATNSQGYAILRVLSDHYNASLSQVGRGMIIYAIRHAKKGDE